MNNVNICIVHFNTPKLTECLVRSINKFTPNSKIYIFDNSNLQPFTYKQDNIVYIDNTKGQIIDFDAWLKGIPASKGSAGAHNKWASAKHCYTIQKCIEIINEPFILLDSDVLLKKDISVLFDENLAFCGEIKDTSRRVYPCVCFINPKILREKNISYFDENYTFELRKTNFRGDTGCVLYMNKDILPHKNIKFNDFVVHYSGGSYSIEIFNKIHKGQISKERWLEAHKSLWEK